MSITYDCDRRPDLNSRMLTLFALRKLTFACYLFKTFVKPHEEARKRCWTVIGGIMRETHKRKPEHARRKKVEITQVRKEGEGGGDGELVREEK